jgi:anti-sigma B factor antagonist
MDGDRPRIVLDCGSLAKCDRSVVLLLLRCLEEAIKRNGDVRLANVGPAASEWLEATRAKRLFEVFDSTAQAVDSFHRFATSAVSPRFLSENLQGVSGNAA